MKIKYKKNRSRLYAIMTILWIALLILNLIYQDSNKGVFWLWIILPVGYIINYSYSYFSQYLTIEDGFIYRNVPFSKKIELNKIKTFKKFAGDYIIKTDRKELTINTTIIDEDSLKSLDQFLSNFEHSQVS